MNCFLITLLSILFITKFVFSQADTSRVFHPLSNAIGITIESGGTISKTDYKFQELDITSRMLLEYYFTSRTFGALGLRLSLSGGFINGEFLSDDITYPPVSENFRTGFFSLGCGLVYAMRFINNIPYISIDVDYINFNPQDKNGFNLPNNKLSVYKKSAINYLVEAGFRFPFADIWSLNLAANINFSNTDYLDDIKTGNNNDAFISCFAGISFYLGKNVDRDNDGIDDNIEICPDTPAGYEVDEFGCSVNGISYAGSVYDTLNDSFISDGIFTDGKLYCFQIDVLSNLNSAKALQNKIHSMGYNTVITKTDLGNIPWYSVRIGYFNSFEVAKFYKVDFFKKTKIKL